MSKINRRSIPALSLSETTTLEKLGPESYRWVRDFELVQPLYDLAFALEITALATQDAIPKYRAFSLWRAGLGLDGYGTLIDRWIRGIASKEDFDYLPSHRIKQHLTHIHKTGTLPELALFDGARFRRALRLRSIRGLGPKAIAESLKLDTLAESWLQSSGVTISLDLARIRNIFSGEDFGSWQSAHVVPPLLRLLGTIETHAGRKLKWSIANITDSLLPITMPPIIASSISWEVLSPFVEKALLEEVHFTRSPLLQSAGFTLRHRMGWLVHFQGVAAAKSRKTIPQWTGLLDPLSRPLDKRIQSDLHSHTAWSDGAASIGAMSSRAADYGLTFIAITDHSRSSKLQGGLTPILWLRQAGALSLLPPKLPVLHGIEVDILKDGTLDFPPALLQLMDLVIASVHSNWTSDIRTNTERILKAIQSGNVDVLAHPTSALTGKPGVPDFVRRQAPVDWDVVFRVCAEWHVALEFNCFPSRLDLAIPLLTRAVAAGCAISFGSDAHARQHLAHSKFGSEVLRNIPQASILNTLPYREFLSFISSARIKRRSLIFTAFQRQAPLFREENISIGKLFKCAVAEPPGVPEGRRVVGIDLTAGDKLTGLALLNGTYVTTTSLATDEDILAFIKEHEPDVVSIDSPLGLPGGRREIDPDAGIVRVAEKDLASIGIPAYPALIDSMKLLTLRGIRIRQELETLPRPPIVIESYPGAAQDVLCIPRKQKGLSLLREGLSRLGLTGPGLETQSHDEMDAITSAVVGRYYEAGLYEPMGVASEAQLIVPKVAPLSFQHHPVICLAGKTGAGKSVVARYLSVFYGFTWIRTRDVIRELLLQDLRKDKPERLWQGEVDEAAISEESLRDFGMAVLTTYKQAPLRQALKRLIVQQNGPVVVDSIRDDVDIDASVSISKPLLIWYIECSDGVINQRIETRTKLGVRRLTRNNIIDSRTSKMRELADDIITNNSSLEELRWRIDDSLFAHLSFVS